jgi:hypothetical protein
MRKYFCRHLHSSLISFPVSAVTVVKSLKKKVPGGQKIAPIFFHANTKGKYLYII